MAKPVPLVLPTDEQVAWFVREAVVAYANAGYAINKGYASPSQVVGRRLAALGPISEASLCLVRDYLASGLSQHKHRWLGSPEAYTVVLHGNVREGRLAEVWGLCSSLGVTEAAAWRRVGELEDQLHTLRSDLHDHLGQNLTCIGLLADLARAHAQSPEARPLLERLASVARTAHADARAMGHAAAAPQAFDLAASLRRLGALAAASGLTCESTVEDVPMPPLVAKQVFRIAQEAVANVLRHAGAQTLRLELQSRPGDATLLVEDDGRGMPDGPGSGPSSGGHGLRTMHTRAHAIAATLYLVSRSEGGLSVRCSVPLPRLA